MTFNSEIKLGPLTRAMCDSPSWKGQDDFPSSQLWADELEKVLSFLQVHAQFECYLPVLKGKLTQRDGALAEARVAFFFHRNGFLILSWEPKGASDNLGEFEISFISTIFGAMSAKVNTVVDFFFGGSSKKNEQQIKK